MTKLFLKLVAFATTGYLFVGCGGTAPSGDEAAARAKMRAVGLEYGRYLGQHGGQAPADDADFRKFIEQRIAQTPDYGVASAEELLAAGRDGQPLTIVAKSVVAPPDQPDLQWAAYEKVGVDGKRLAVNVRGTVVELGPDEFSQAIPIK